MRTVTVHEAKTHLSRLIQCALDGDDIVIVQSKKPVVRLVAVEPEPGKRKIGAAKGMVKILPSFDEPLEDFSN